MGFETLPSEVLREIIKPVNPLERISARLVCTAFHKAAVMVLRQSDPLEILAYQVAQTSSAGILYGPPSPLFHPDRRRMFLQVPATRETRLKFNDLLIAAFMELNNITAQQMQAWLPSNPVLNAGPAHVNPVQLAELLSGFRDGQDEDELDD